jgi:putative peptide maturation dehydrogenase
MQVRRCAIVTLEPREKLEFNLALVSAGGSGLRKTVEWVALAPHLTEEIALGNDEVLVLGAVSPSRWAELDELANTHPRGAIDSLLAQGLLVAESTEADTRDRVLRGAHWRCASAVMHYASRWRGVDTEAMAQQFSEIGAGDLLERLGPPPPPARERVPADERHRLAAAQPTALDALLDRRVTCRNYDTSRALPQDSFASVLYRVFGARAVDDFAPGVKLLKKGVPSAGGLHPTEAYLLVQNVAGIEAGLYHYHAIDHALEPIQPIPADETAALARRFVAAQDYFVGAHVLVIPVSRFARNFWKYRNHAKAYRTLLLDVGHLSQTLYLAATELGLAAFITAAVNEVDIEEAFALDPLEEGALAVCGFGLRAAERREVEFDPLGAVWHTA